MDSESIYLGSNPSPAASILACYNEAMRIIICGSVSAADEILAIQTKLKAQGHETEIPEGVKNLELRARTEVSNEEKMDDKVKYDVIRNYFEKMKEYDAALIVNPE